LHQKEAFSPFMVQWVALYVVDSARLIRKKRRKGKLNRGGVGVPQIRSNALMRLELRVKKVPPEAVLTPFVRVEAGRARSLRGRWGESGCGIECKISVENKNK
jgi:hypothetical protein